MAPNPTRMSKAPFGGGTNRPPGRSIPRHHRLLALMNNSERTRELELENVPKLLQPAMNIISVPRKHVIGSSDQTIVEPNLSHRVQTLCNELEVFVVGNL